MNDPDPPHTFQLLRPMIIGAINRLQNTSGLNLPRLQFSTDKAVMDFMIQLDTAYRQQLANQISNDQKSVLHTVQKPQNSEFEPIAEKKVKLSSNNPPQIDSLLVNHRSNVAEPMALDIKVEEEKYEQVISKPFENSSLSSLSLKSIENNDKLSDVAKALKTEHIERIKPSQEDISKPAAKPSHSIQHDSQLNSNLANERMIEKKDLKKFEKFENFLAEYLQKLSIANPAVEKKYLEILRIVVPRLATNFKSKPFEAIAAAILLYACREVQCPIAIKQIIQASNSQEKLINKCIFSIKEILPNKDEIKLFKADEFVLKIGDKLLISDAIKQTAIKIGDTIEKLNLGKSNHPATLACCCIKFACALSDEDRGFDLIAEAAGINKMTLRNMYRELYADRFRFIASDGVYSKSLNELPNI